MKILLILSALAGSIYFVNNKSDNMDQNDQRVTVWDTYVTKKNGQIMHFDIIAPVAVTDTAVIHGYGRDYLATKGQAGQKLTAKECRRCHVRKLSPQWEADINKQGYYILEMEGCDD